MEKNNKSIRILMSVFLVLLSSCQSNEKYSDAECISFSDFGEVIYLKGDSVAFDDILLKPVKIHLVDSILIMKNRNTEYAYYIFNILTKKKIGERVSFGIGPNEMIDPRFIPSTDDNAWIFDKNRKILNICDRQKFLKEENLEINKTIEFEDFCDNIVFIPSKGFIASVFKLNNKRFGLFNLEGDTICYKGEYPTLSSLQTNIEQVEQFINEFTANVEEDRVFVSYKRTDLIECYDTDMNLIKRIHGPEHFFPEVHQVGDRIRTNKGTERDAYSFPLSVGKKVFVLYSGKVFNPRNHDYLKDKILVFDWNGNPQQCYQLDIPIFDFAVDEKSRIIYGLTDKPESHIIQFKF